jgi:hypothetical protein
MHETGGNITTDTRISDRYGHNGVKQRMTGMREN